MKYLAKALLIVLLSAQIAQGSASDYNATTSRLAVAHFAGIAPAAMTIGCWIFRDSDGENTVGRLFDKGTTVTTGFIWTIGSSVLTLYYPWSTSGSGRARWNWTIPSTGAWHHFVLGYDNASAANDPALWLNAAVYSTGFFEDTAPSGTAAAGTRVLNIGNDPTSAGTWDGRLADCFFYDRVLNINEVKQVMHKGPNSVKNGLVCYWPMGAFVGFSTGGSGGTSCNGTFTDNVIVNTGPPVSVPQGGFGW